MPMELCVLLARQEQPSQPTTSGFTSRNLTIHLQSDAEGKDTIQYSVNEWSVQMHSVTEPVQTPPSLSITVHTK